MNEQVKIFESPQFGQIRTAGTSEQPLFCLADICKVLELRTTDVKNRLKSGGVDSIVVGVQTGVKADGTPAIQQVEMLFVNEANLYRVIMRSDKPQAEAFQDWVCGEVLPSIRRSGGYIASTAQDTPEMIMARALKLADETMKRQQAQLQEANTTIKEQHQQLQMAEGTIEEQTKVIGAMKPLAEFASEVLASKTGYTLTEMSKDLDFKSVHKFTAWAKSMNILYRQGDVWMPTANWSGRNYFTSYTYKYLTYNNTVVSRIQLLVTERGRAAMHYALKHFRRPSDLQLEQYNNL